MGLFKKIGKGLKKLEKGVVKDIGKVGKAVIKVDKKIIKGAEYVVLAPFKGMMKKELDNRKIAHTNKMADICTKFHVNVVHGTSHFEMQNLGEDIATGIVQEIIDWIKGVKAKKAAGVKLSPTEEAVLQGADTAAATTKGIIKGHTANTAGSFLTTNWIPISAAVLLLLFFAFKKK